MSWLFVALVCLCQLYSQLCQSKAVRSQRYYGTLGIDMSTLVSESAFRCFRREGYTFAIPRAYRSLGQVDPNAVRNIRNAREAGFTDIDVYMFPCVGPCHNGKTATEQAEEMLSGLSSVDWMYRKIWIDVEHFNDKNGHPANWKQSHAENIAFIRELVEAIGVLADYRHPIGIVSQKRQWQAITGDTDAFYYLGRIWYLHWDNKENFDDWYATENSHSFGSWHRPTMKQIRGNAKTPCKGSVDVDYKERGWWTKSG